MRARAVWRPERILLSQAAGQADEAAASETLATLLGKGAEKSFVTEGLALPARVLRTQPPCIGRISSLPSWRSRPVTPRSRSPGRSRWQDVGLGLFAEGERNRDEPEGIEPEGLLGMRVSVPFPLWQDGRAKVDEKAGGPNPPEA